MYGFILSSCLFLFKRNYLQIITALVLLFYIFATGSRSALLIAILSFMVMIILFFGRKKWYLSLGIIASVIALFVIVLSLPPFATFADRLIASLKVLIDGETSSDMSTTFRLEYLYEGIELIVRKPIFGYGEAYIFRTLSLTGQDTHNNFIELGVDYGLLSLIIYEGFLIYSFIKIHKQKNEEKNLYLVWLIAIFLAQFFYPIYSLKVEFLLFCFIVAFASRDKVEFSKSFNFVPEVKITYEE
jgi:O-antigen ligase